MKNNNTIWLQIDTYNENNECETIEFEVTKDWLKKHIDNSLGEFLDEYTSEESEQIYGLAILENALINEK